MSLDNSTPAASRASITDYSDQTQSDSSWYLPPAAGAPPWQPDPVEPQDWDPRSVEHLGLSEAQDFPDRMSWMHLTTWRSS